MNLKIALPTFNFARRDATLLLKHLVKHSLIHIKHGFQAPFFDHLSSYLQVAWSSQSETVLKKGRNKIHFKIYRTKEKNI